MSENEGTQYIDRLKEELLDPVHVKQSWEGRGVDPLLQWLVDISNRSNQSFLVTLTVGGNLVSGLLISLDEYLDEWAAQASGQINHQESALFVKDTVLGWKVDKTQKQPAAQLIHLKDAEVFTSNGRPIAPGGVLWRGKISSVDGFNLGRLVVTEPSS